VTEQIRIPISTLRHAAEVLLAHVEALEGEFVSVDKDYYWVIPSEQLYDVFHEPSDLTIGQLGECVEQLDAVVADPARATSYALVWLADLVRAVGQSVLR
jgi:hypothetical protein